MKKLILTIPESVNLNEHEVKMLLAGKLYENGKFTLGEAAPRLLGVGVSKRVFIELIGKYGFSIGSDSIEGLQSNIKSS